MTFNIEKGIPRNPDSCRSSHAEIAKQMQIDDSILVEDDKQAHGLMMAFRNRGMRGSRRVQEDGKFRVWRIS